MKEFKPQFQPALITCGSVKKHAGYGPKHYVAGFVQGRSLIHESRIHHKTATAAQHYAKKVFARYQRMMQAALLAFVESQNVELVN